MSVSNTHAQGSDNWISGTGPGTGQASWKILNLLGIMALNHSRKGNLTGGTARIAGGPSAFTGDTACNVRKNLLEKPKYNLYFRNGGYP